jgi:hypothetical protein
MIIQYAIAPKLNTIFEYSFHFCTLCYAIQHSGPISYPPISLSPCVQCFLHLPSPHWTPSNLSHPTHTLHYIHFIFQLLLVAPRICPWYFHATPRKKQKNAIPTRFLWNIPKYSHEFIPAWYYIPTRIWFLFPLYFHYISITSPLYFHYIPMSLFIPMIFPLNSHDFPLVFPSKSG